MKNERDAISWLRQVFKGGLKLGVSQDCMKIVAVRFTQNVFCPQSNILENNPSTYEISI